MHEHVCKAVEMVKSKEESVSDMEGMTERGKPEKVRGGRMPSSQRWTFTFYSLYLNTEVFNNRHVLLL